MKLHVSQKRHTGKMLRTVKKSHGNGINEVEGSTRAAEHRSRIRIINHFSGSTGIMQLGRLGKCNEIVTLRYCRDPNFSLAANDAHVDEGGSFCPCPSFLSIFGASSAPVNR